MTIIEDRVVSREVRRPATRSVDARQAALAAKNTVACVLAGGRGSRLKQLTEGRAKPSVAFGGKFRIIDFTLSNCINLSLIHI